MIESLKQFCSHIHHASLNGRGVLQCPDCGHALLHSSIRRCAHGVFLPDGDETNHNPACSVCTSGGIVSLGHDNKCRTCHQSLPEADVLDLPDMPDVPDAPAIVFEKEAKKEASFPVPSEAAGVATSLPHLYTNTTVDFSKGDP